MPGVILGHGNSLGPAGRQTHFIAVLPKPVPQTLSHGSFVINYKNADLFAHPATSDTVPYKVYLSCRIPA